MKTLIFLLLISISALAQQKSIYGYVVDSSNVELLADVMIKTNNKQGVYTNQYGYFFLDLDSSASSITFSYVGYKSKHVYLSDVKDKNNKLIISLSPAILSASNILVEGNSIPEKKIGRDVIPISDIKQMPSIGGETDPIKAIHIFPGVLKSNEGGTSFHVRGGDFDQNLILLDGIHVYNINHFFGFLSVFNVDALKQMEFIRSGFKPIYGGKLSSVLNLSLKEGNQNQFAYSGGISLLSSRLLIEGPLDENSSMMFSIRRTYLDPLINMINDNLPVESDKLAEYSFWDVNAKVKIGLSELSTLYLSTYFGNDDLDWSQTGDPNEQDLRFKMDWGNKTYLLRWNYLWSRRLFSNVSLGYTTYSAKLDLDADYFSGTQRQPDISDYVLNFNMDYYFSENVFINYGYQLKNHQIGIAPTETKFYFNENALFANLEYQINDLLVNTGLRNTILSGMEYNRINPRFSIDYQLNPSWQLNLSYDQMSQPIHKLSFNNILNPGDLYYPSSSKINPQESRQYSMGINWQQKKNKYSLNFSTSLFYKCMDNLTTFIYNIENVDKRSLEENLTVGKGTAKGVELDLNFKDTDLQLMVNYSYLNSWRTYPDKNKGERFQPNFDRTHYLNFFAMHPVTQSFSVSATYNVSSGQIINYAVQKYNIYGILPDMGDQNTFFDYGQLNRIRTNVIMRLDLSINYKYTEHWEFFLSVYNALGNEYPIFYEYENFTSEPKYSGTSLGFLPTFGFNFSY